MLPCLCAAVLATAGSLLCASRAAAMVVVKRSFPELVARAEQIVVGTVAEVRQGPDPSGAPCTWVSVTDLTVLKGEVGRTLTLRFFGGGDGPTAVRIPDMPSFAPGERVVLFVAGNGRALCPLVGVWQGRFNVRHDDRRGTDIVEDNEHVPVTGRIGANLERGGGGAGGAALTLDEFVTLIADELTRPSPSTTPAL